MYDFNYHRAADTQDAANKLKAAEDGKYIAGGMTLLPTLKLRLAQPSDLVDLGSIDTLRGISEEGDSLVIGAMTTHGAVAGSDAVKSRIPALAHMADGIGDAQVRNRGTLGGSIANADPAADYPAALVGLAATVVTNQREIAADDFFTEMFETALAEDEIVTAVRFPVPQAAGYVKFPNPASRYAVVGVMVARTSSGVRVAVTGAGPSVFRSAEMEQALTADFSPEAVADIQIDDAEFNEDMHATAQYRAHLVTVMAKRAVAEASG